MNYKLIGIKEMAQKLDVSVTLIYARTRKKEIPFYRLGKYCKFDETEVMEWIKRKNRVEIRV